MKRAADIIISFVVLVLISPIMLLAISAVWAYDRHSPFYMAPRAGLGNSNFKMVKIRSMRVDADKIGGSSTAATDRRITPVGQYIRRLKLDEFSQFWNVIRGDMSIVGPRPNARNNGVDLYTAEEMRLLTVKPGITDLSSIIFSDEGNILAGCPEPDELYDQIIRPWKSRLGLLYVDERTIWLDFRVMWLTGVAFFSKRHARLGVDAILARLGVDSKLRDICRREAPLPAGLPPGATGLT